MDTDYDRGRRKQAKKRRHWLRRLRKGDVVSACYDGKGGRAVRAVVIKQRKGVVVAEFQRGADEGIARVRFVDGGGWDRGGWMPLASGGAWYRIWPASAEVACDANDASRGNPVTTEPPKAPDVYRADTDGLYYHKRDLESECDGDVLIPKAGAIPRDRRTGDPSAQ